MRLKGFSNTCEEDGKHSLLWKKKKKPSVLQNFAHSFRVERFLFFFFFL